MTIQITSEIFKNGEPIPDRYACNGVNVSPSLEWDSVSGTVKYAIICEDPDAPSGTWTHWVIFNIPSDTTGLSEWVMEREELENGAKQGLNDFGTVGYRGPCPPDGTHRYYFTVYALDTEIEIPAKITKQDLLKAMKDHIIDEGSLMGRYTR
ncbi:YbhB/YbcL family Raf kinase inhibitor-like protein [Methanobacterium spitsbergense]|uniref:YbhB/YbcL family Raf kinase inhibitor-like protein n=1 Tax=Methanobacterium spitsbergense TaxID=2874285 RepID=A0A8T5UQT0_9EURY|nr:YbhB/YbcL family Raf kinase inhibitor-like protein [Methanobacterium spitsbergense]MBZ2166034.1 YbhB/YbcL family Raf kinase inhibitor-like protein [Methanobacterium spitsbergense]